jgi:ABC-type multidrug transport system ATPase subunit
LECNLISGFQVDAHTAHILYSECLKGDLMRGRTIILVSHHVQLCAPGASYIVTLENGRVLYEGDRDGFQSSGVMQNLAHSGAVESTGQDEAETVVRETTEELLVDEKEDGGGSSTPNTEIPSENDSLGGVTSVDENPAQKKKGPRKLVEEETRAVGRVDRTVWKTYFKACGEAPYWLTFALAFVLAAVSPVAENGWLRYVRRPK